MNITSVLGLCIIAAMLCLLLIGYRAEYAMAVMLLAGLFVFTLCIGYISPAIEEIKTLLTRAGLELSQFKIALKALGICYITQFSADLCRDFGQTSLAAKAELVGKCVVFVLSIPLISAVIEIALSFIGEI